MRFLLALVLLVPTLPASPLHAQTLDEKIAAHQRPAMDTAEATTYLSNGLTLKARLYKPAGPGPFPAILWNHGSETNPGPQVELARFYNEHGFILYCPIRSGQGGNPGPYILDEQKGLDQATAIALQDKANQDVAAALAWLRAQPFVRKDQIVVSGVSYGGIQTLISAEKLSGVRAFIAFAPGAMSWANKELQKRLTQAVVNAHAPVFILQAANDYSTGPVDTLGPLLTHKGSLNRAKLYPRFGPPDQHQIGHSGFATWAIATDIWGPDVLDFIHQSFAQPKH